MHCLRVAAAALNQTPLDWAGNLAHIRSAIEQARAAAVSLLVLPELAISGYGCEDAFLGMGVCERSLAGLDSLRPLSTGMVIVVGLPLAWHGAIYNVAAVLVDGQVAAMVAKQHLAGDGLHYEPRWFKPWPAGKQVTFRHGDWSCPLGDAFLDIGGLRMALEICEDAWVAQRPTVRLADQAIDIVANPSASHFAFGKQLVRERIVGEGSRSTGATYIYANLLGNEAGRVIFDGGALVATAGNLIARGPRFCLDDVTLCVAHIDVDITRRKLAASASAEPRVDDAPTCVHLDYQLPWAGPGRTEPDQESWEVGPHLKEEEFCRALCLGLIDYVRKSHSRGFVISLSGGADSAAIACLVRHAWAMGLAHFGDGAWQQRIGMPPETTLEDWCSCVYQGTVNSSATTHDAARDLALALGHRFHAIVVDELVAAYRSRVEAMLGRELSWERDDIPLQNIQARARAPGVWMLANCLGALLLSTSNRSEAAVGYATMDGDTCGGLSPIAGIDKAFLRCWLRWAEEQGPQGLDPIPALRAVNVQQPTAELRPSAAKQTDEEDLMPYPVLDRIERLAIRDKHPPEACLAQLAVDFPEAEQGQLIEWVQRFFRLWCRNQWKRERYAPSFHLDDENLDPKTWCRFPILSGGFSQELGELEQGHG